MQKTCLFDEVEKLIGNKDYESLIHNIWINILTEYDLFVYDKINSELENMVDDVTKDKYNYRVVDMAKDYLSDIFENIDKYRILYFKLQDDLSKEVLVNILLFRLTWKRTYIYDAYCENSECYFDQGIVRYKEGAFVDCGALDGLNTIEYIMHSPLLGNLYVYEPMEKYFLECGQTLRKLKTALDDKKIEVRLRNAAVFDKNKSVRFNYNSRGTSSVDCDGHIEVQAISLDNDVKEKISFIKMDIEGSEEKALRGGGMHIREEEPMMTISVYHRPEDLWKVPLLILELDPNYTLVLRHHTLWTDDTVCYAVPQDGIIEDALSQKDSLLYLLCIREKYKDIKCKFDNCMISKQWLLSQVCQKDSCIMELRDWMHQLELGKQWLEEQYKNYKNLYEHLTEDSK